MRAPEDSNRELAGTVARRYGLTAREEEVLGELLGSKTLSEAAERLCIAPSTMKTHTRHIYRKVGVANVEELRELVLGS